MARAHKLVAIVWGGRAVCDYTVSALKRIGKYDAGVFHSKTHRNLTLSRIFQSKNTVLMEQLERLYRYNEEVDSSFAEPAIASSSSRWRDACADDRIVAPASDDTLRSETLMQILTSHIETVQTSLVFPCSPNSLCQTNAVKSSTPTAGFLTPRSPATLSCCSTPRKFN
jgi:hypothetical protein